MSNQYTTYNFVQKFKEPEAEIRWQLIFFYRATCMHSADYMPWQLTDGGQTSGKIPACLSHAGILSKRLNISLKLFHHRVVRPV